GDRASRRGAVHGAVVDLEGETVRAVVVLAGRVRLVGAGAGQRAVAGAGVDGVGQLIPVGVRAGQGDGERGILIRGHRLRIGDRSGVDAEGSRGGGRVARLVVGRGGPAVAAPGQGAGVVGDLPAVGR